MQAIIPGQANTITHDLVKVADGEALTEGTVSFYVLALTGPNAGKWFKAEDETWSATEAPAGTGSRKVRALWHCSIPAAAWSYGVLYAKYAMDSGNLCVFYNEQVVPSLALGTVGAGAIEYDYTLTDTSTGRPIAGATVWVTTDRSGQNIVGRGTTNDLGVVTFWLTGGEYHFWSRKAGYDFNNPDTEIVT